MRRDALTAIPLSFLALVVLVARCSPHTPAALSDADLARTVAQAEQHYNAQEKQGGLVGLKTDILACYAQLGKEAGEAKVAYCVALDDMTTRSNEIYGPGAEKIMPYFTFGQFNDRATAAAKNSAAGADAAAFQKRVLTAADPAAKRAADAQARLFNQQ